MLPLGQKLEVLPPNLAGLPFWLDGFDVNLLHNVGIADLDPVGTWKNKGGGGATYDVTQATAGSKPTFYASRINTHPAVVGDGGDVLAGINPVAQNAARHIFAVITVPATLGGNYIGPRNGIGYVLTAGANNTQVESNNTTNACTIASAPSAGNSIFELSFDGNILNNPTCVISGVAQTVSGGGVALEGATDTLFVGTNFTEAIGEILFYNAVQSAGDVTAARSYLSGKWGISV